MSETLSPQKLEDKIKEEFVKRAKIYLEENEATIVLNKILYMLNNWADEIEDTINELSRLYVSLKTNSYSTNVRIRSEKLYGYGIDEVIPEIFGIYRDYIELEIRLPNNIIVGNVDFNYDNESLLQKESQLKLRQYKQELKEVVRAIKEGIQKASEANKKEEEENE